MVALTTKTNTNTSSVSIQTRSQSHLNNNNNNNSSKKKRRKLVNNKEVGQDSESPRPADEDPEMESRLAWISASTALEHMKRGNVTGNKPALWLRSKLQSELFTIGNFIQNHAGKVLFVGVVVLLAFCLGLKSAEMEHKVEKLWVEDGGNLEKELDYVRTHLGEGSGASNEMLIQTPRDEERGSILTPDALLSHLEILKSASKVIVFKDDTTWKLKDLCYAQTIPMSELQVVNTILENLFPCAIITPLDCFWEGSKLLGPDMPVPIPLGDGEGGSAMLSWTTLNPSHLVRQMNSYSKYFDFRSFEDYMKRAGISTGYQEKPCLNPKDPECPSSAPNKNSNKTLDVGAELSGGCYGFATRYNHWPEELVVGGTTKNKSGHIIKAKGLQSVVQLMGEKDLFDYWSETYKTHTLKWSQTTANEILSEWQAKFSEEVKRLATQSGNENKKIINKYDINTFSTSNLETVLEEFSSFSPTRVALGYALMLIYAGVSLFRWSDVIQSQAGLGVSGVVLVTMTIAGGLGLCALLGMKFNASTSQILPYLSLGLGVDALFLMAKSYSDQLIAGTVPLENQIGEVLSRTGVLIVIIAVCLVAAFLLSSLVIPIPAMRGLGLQASVLTAFNLFAMIFLFPAIMALDLRRVASGNMDLWCCFHEKKQMCLNLPRELKDCNVSRFAKNHFAKWIGLAPIKFIVTITSVVLTVIGVWGAATMENGLSLTDVVPHNTSVFRFLDAQNKYFGFYNMYAVTAGNIEYPQNQKLLYDYQKAFVRIPNIIKDDDGGLPEFWLSLFRTWLVKIQRSFDENEASGNYKKDGWHPNATEEGILAFKLMVQTGQVDHPTDFKLAENNRLVDEHGIINPAAFYNYLSAWYANDAMAYSFSQANLRPHPREWIHEVYDDDLKIPKSPPIEFAQIPFYLNNLGETSEMVETIQMIRDLCNKFEKRGLPNFPRGVPFTFWEQYLSLRFWLFVALASILSAIFVVLSFVFMSVWTSAITVFVIALMIIQLIGLMNLVGIKLSAIPAVLLILTAGIGVQFTLHVVMGFITSIGNKNTRIRLSLEQMLGPVVHGAISTFLGIVMLAFSEFEFVFKYFFLVIVGILVLGLFNGLVVLPILLAFIGPPAQVILNDNLDRLPAIGSLGERLESSKRQIKVETKKNNNKFQLANSLNKNNFNAKIHNSDLSLSTIAEESNSYLTSSQSSSSSFQQQQQQQQQSNLTTQSLNGAANVIVEPRVVVETTTFPSNSSGHSSRCSTPTQVTKVTATASFKVEVHAPSTSSSIERPASRKSRRSRVSNSTTKKEKGEDQLSSSSVHSSLTDSANSSLTSSLNSNPGDLGFSER